MVHVHEGGIFYEHRWAVLVGLVCIVRRNENIFINEMLGKDCALEDRTEKLGELLQHEHSIIELPRAVRVRLLYSKRRTPKRELYKRRTPKSGGKNEYIVEFIVKHIRELTSLLVHYLCSPHHQYRLPKHAAAKACRSGKVDAPDLMRSRSMPSGTRIVSR